MKLKQFFAAAAALLIAITPTTAMAESSGFYSESELCRAVKAPSETKYVNVAWNTEQAENVGVPMSWNTTALLPIGSSLNAYSEKNGSPAGSAALFENAASDFRGAVLGNTIVQPTETGISVINAQTMQVTSEKSFGAPISSDVALIDDFAYFAVQGEEYKFICANLANGLETVWEYSSDCALSAATDYKEYVVFAAGTKLVCCDAKTGEAVENELGFSVSGAPYAAEYAVYLSGEDGSVYKLRLNSDGTIEQDTLTPCAVGGALSSPLMWNGKVYVSSSEGFFILDSLTMEVLKSYPEMAGCTAPLVCYGNGTHVYITAPLEDYWCLYTIFDMEEFDEPQVSKLAKLVNFEGGKVAVASDGTMYFRDAVGRLYALQVAEYSLVLIIVKLVLLLGIIVLLFLLLRKWAKDRAAARPPQY